MFNRRDLLRTGAALAVGPVSRRAMAGPADVRKLRIGYLLSTESQLGAGAIAMADEVATRTGGRIRIEQFPDSTLGGEVEMLRGVQLGTVDLAFITGAPLPNVLPAAGIFNADSDDGGHRFRFDRGHRSDLMAARLASSRGPILVMS